MNTNIDSAVFRDGDEVVLAEGTYQGTPGRFLRLRTDTAWADIEERNGVVRNHPVAWLAHAERSGEYPQPPGTSSQNKGTN
jgi:hypothetical protein